MKDLNQYRLLLTKLHDGDYAHAGGTEAITMVLDRLLDLSPSLKDVNVLDVGSGFGGTAKHLYSQGFKQIYGIDIDESAVIYSRKTCSNICFSVCDALKVDKLFLNKKFGLIYLFNVAYAINDKESLISSLTKVAKENAILLLFDYSNPHGVMSGDIRDLSNKPILPIKLDHIKKVLPKYGWSILSIEDMSQKYVYWYRNLLKRLECEYGFLLQKFDNSVLLRVQNVFNLLLNDLLYSKLSATTIYARLDQTRSSFVCS